MGRSCGRAIVYRRLYTLSTDVVVYIWKKKIHTYLAEKKNAYYRAFGYKRRKPSTIVHMKKRKRKKKAVFPLKKMFLVRGGYDFPGLPTTWNTFEMWSQC